MKTVFVTGGTGFIGSHTVERLLSKGYRVRCLVRNRQPNYKWLKDPQVEIVAGNLLDSASLLNCFNDVDYVIHIAGITKAKRKSDFFEGNSKATERLLTVVSKFKRLKKFCYISSLTAVGPSPDGHPLSETAECHPITTYGRSKLEAEQICKRFFNEIPIVIIRPPAVFGPRDTDILEMFKWVNLGFKPIIGSREKTLSLVYAPDLAEGIIQSTINGNTSGQIYNISDPKIFAFSSLIETLATFSHKRTMNIYLPKVLIYTMAGISEYASVLGRKAAVFNIEKARDLLQKHWVCDSNKIREHIGFQTSTSIHNGMAETYKWYKENRWL